MLALYIALAVVVVALVVLLLLVLGRRGRRGASAEASTGTTLERPTQRPPQGSVAAPPAPTEPVAPEVAPPVAEPAPGVVTEPAPGVVAEPEPEPIGPPPSLRERLGKARGIFSGVVGSVRRSGPDASTWEDLEEALLRADVGVATTDALLADLRRRVDAKELPKGDDLIDALRADLVDLLEVEDRWDAASDGHGTDAAPTEEGREEKVEPVGRALRFDPEPGVTNVWLFVGVNGVGKTTTVGKLARREAAAGRSVLLAAGDTFRAAAGEQLQMWAERSGAEIVRGAEGGDPSAIVFDAVQRAAARGNELVLADTAGRLHTKVNLVEELRKIRRVADRQPGRVTEVLLVIDATTGQNGLVQARQFTDAVAVTGIVLTKLDGTAKGGVVISIQRELGLPVKLVGLGEGPDDLVPFDPEEFVDALLG